MTGNNLFLVTTASLLLAAGLGCAHNYPPPPPPIAQAPPLVQLAEHNGFETGRSDGAGASANGFPFAPRRTRAYHDTPGYDPHLGPFGPYQNAFRSAYLRGYDKGFYRR
jgi:hypothetical protein